MWPKQPYDVMLCLESHLMLERKVNMKKLRRRKGRKMRCQNYKNYGHNKKTCKAAFAPSAKPVKLPVSVLTFCCWHKPICIRYSWFYIVDIGEEKITSKSSKIEAKEGCKSSKCKSKEYNNNIKGCNTKICEAKEGCSTWWIWYLYSPWFWEHLC